MNKDALLTAGAIAKFTSGAAAQAFLRDTLAPGFQVRATRTGTKSFIFQRRVNGRQWRHTIGDVRAWQIDKARDEARRLWTAIDAGADPQTLFAPPEAVEPPPAPADTTFGALWVRYCTEAGARWGERHRSDHDKMVAPGGVKKARGTRGTGITQPGILYPLLTEDVSELTTARIEQWVTDNAHRQTQTRLALRMLSAFMNWCKDEGLVEAGAAQIKNKKVRNAAGKGSSKTDTLTREQLGVWFKAAREWPNRTQSACLQVSLLIGARPLEVRSMRWSDISERWATIVIRDKVEGVRTIPLTPHVAGLLAELPRINDFVFASASAESGHISSPNSALTSICQQAGVPHVTLHGLRRSFKSLSEWLALPVGVVAQIMGHKPSATAEKHYTVRPIDLLRIHHEAFEKWIIEQGNI